MIWILIEIRIMVGFFPEVPNRIWISNRHLSHFNYIHSKNPCHRIRRIIKQFWMWRFFQKTKKDCRSTRFGSPSEPQSVSPSASPSPFNLIDLCGSDLEPAMRAVCGREADGTRRAEKPAGTRFVKLYNLEIWLCGMDLIALERKISRKPIIRSVVFEI